MKPRRRFSRPVRRFPSAKSTTCSTPCRTAGTRIIPATVPLRAGFRRLCRHALCAGHVELHRRAASVAVGLGRRARRRSARAGGHLDRHGQRRELHRRDARVRRYRPGHLVPRSRQRRRGDHAAHQGHHAGASLRPSDRHDVDLQLADEHGAEGAGRRRAGPRRRDRRAQGRQHRPRRLLQLSRGEDHDLRRRGHARHQR